LAAFSCSGAALVIFTASASSLSWAPSG
jgi:hypothetical protein